MANGPSDERISLEDTQDFAVKRPSAKYIYALADRGDSRSDLSSSDGIEQAGRENGIVQLLREAKFVAGVFDAN